jgi:hypothetical protein
MTHDLKCMVSSLIFLQFCQLVSHGDDPPGADADVVLDGLRHDGAAAHEVVGTGQDQASPRKLVWAAI